MADTMQRGLFITLEGGEGSGKSTQIKRLVTALEQAGHDVLLTREPGGSDAGEAMRDLFIKYDGARWPVEAQALLMFAARAHHTETMIKPALENGKIVISDRYTDSTRVYQGVAGGMKNDKIESLKQVAIGDFEPDLTFLLDIEPEIGLARGHGRGNDTDTTFETKMIAFHNMLRQGYLDIANDNPQRCVIVNAEQDMDTISETLKTKTLEKIKQHV